MKRRLVAVSLVLALGLSGCAFSSASPEQTAATQAKQAVTLEVVTSYGGDDGSRGTFEAAVAAYEAATGNKVRDGSATSNEGWKAKVLADFETGSEPDVLFFFTNADADPIINAGRVISIEDIREVYPDYASNMKQSMLARRLRTESIMPFLPPGIGKIFLSISRCWKPAAFRCRRRITRGSSFFPTARPSKAVATSPLPVRWWRCRIICLSLPL